MRQLGLAIVLSFLSLQVFAGQSKVILTSVVEKSQKVYHHVDGQQAKFEQVTGDVLSTNAITGTGVFSSVNQVEPKHDKAVPGVDVDGHSWITLEERDGKIYLNQDILINDELNGIQINVPFKFSVEVEFVQGSWSEFLSGKPVELRYTEQGQQMASEQTTSKLQKVMRQVRDQIQGRFAAQGAKVSDIRVDSHEVSGRTVIRGDIDRLETQGVPSKTVMSFTVEM